MHRFHAPGATPPVVSLPPTEATHAVRVLRLKNGDDVAVFDGTGKEWRGRIETADVRDVRVNLVEPIAPAPEPSVHVTLATGLLKREDMDTVVRDATMLGVAAIRPIISQRVVVPAHARQEASIERWRRIAVASAKQCGRAVVPAVLPATPFEACLQQSDLGSRVLCLEPSWPGAVGPTSIPKPASAMLFVGPEGGWDASEIDAARRAGAALLGLGPRRLRAEAAPMVALAALWTAWGWL